MSNEDNYWDRKHVHYCTEAYQSCQEVSTACGIKLSTWAAPDLPWRQSGNKYGTEPHPERDLGYSFGFEAVTCPECLKWIDEKARKCARCGKPCVYSLCAACSSSMTDEEMQAFFDEV